MVKFLALLFSLGSLAMADVPLTASEASSIRSLDLSEIQAKALELDGKIIKAKFNYRSKDAGKEADGAVTGTLRLWKTRNTISPTLQYRSGMLEVKVPPEGATWFLGVSTSDESHAALVVFLRIHTGTSGIERAEVLGRELKTDLKGARIVW